MGGSLRFESTPGTGSTFYLSLKRPVVRGPPAARRQAPTSRSILLLEPCDMTRKVLKAKLLRWGCRNVTTCGKLETALEMLQSRFLANGEVPVVLVGTALPTDVLGHFENSSAAVVLLGTQRPESIVHRFVKKPISDAELYGALASPRGEALVSGKKTKRSFPPIEILVAEDNVLYQAVLGKMLAALGQTSVRFACNGKEAVTAAQQRHPELVLMDVVMPVQVRSLQL